MLAVAALKTVQRHLETATPDSTLRVIDALGWSDSGAQVVWDPATPSVGRLYLGSYPTTASIGRSNGQIEPSKSSRAVYFGGYRWRMEISRGLLWWCDVTSAESWSARPNELSRDVLEGFTPDYFARTGRFEPHAASHLRLLPLQDLPSKTPTEYFLETISRWWADYLRDEVEQSQEEIAKRQFTCVLSALLLLRTIEDLGRVSWLGKGTLLETAHKAKKSGEPIFSLFKKASKQLNSRILRSVVDMDIPHGALSKLIEVFYSLDIDFSTLDVDPVGAFYEKVLGTKNTIRPNPQRSLFGRSQFVDEDRSVRKLLGAYFTPRPYADLLARHLILPEARIAKRADELPIIIDLAAGSGELLCAALRQVLSVRAWRTPEVAWQVLQKSIYAIDINPLALQLAALNVLRTAIRLVPALLETGKPLPKLDDNFIEGNALRIPTLARVPQADIALLNPPFHGWKNWGLPDAPLPEIVPFAKKTNVVFAFIAAALSKLRDGGGLGALLPSQLITSHQSKNSREKIAETLRLETIISNLSDTFSDAHSYAGAIIGHKILSDWRPRTRFVEIPGDIKHNQADAFAIASGAGSPTSRVSERLVTIAPNALWRWTGEDTSHISAVRRLGWVPLKELLASKEPVHQGVVVAPSPWGQDLFLFIDQGNGQVLHKATGQRFDASTPALKKVSSPNELQTTPLFAEPIVKNLRVFVPGDGSSAGVSLVDLRKSDPTAFTIASAICDHVLSTRLSHPSDPCRSFVAVLKEGRLRFSRPKGYIISSEPLLVLTEATRSPVGQGRGVQWSAWINSDGTAVPLSGLYARVPRLEYAVALAVLLNTPGSIGSVLRDAPARNMGTTKPRLTSLWNWDVPDLRRNDLQDIQKELLAAFNKYRKATSGLSQREAAKTPEYAELLKFGEKLWRQ